VPNSETNLPNQKIVVITPMRNEDWILRPFLTACSAFADYIIVGDHNSNDNSLKICEDFPKVKVIQANFSDFSERDRRNQLLLEAREFGSNNLIFSLDADEFMSENPLITGQIDRMLEFPVGTQFRMDFFNLDKDLKHGWSVKLDPNAFIDDGGLHKHTNDIHFPRLPKRKDAEIVELGKVSIVHLQFVDWHRMMSKHAWYQAWERVNFPKKSAVDIYRRYHHMFVVPARNKMPMPSTWLEHLCEVGIDLGKLAEPKKQYWWDAETRKLIKSYGPEHFRNVDLSGFFRETGPRATSAFWKYVTTTQPYTGGAKYSPIRLAIRFADMILGKFWL
jgi:glycosyltransferase involved in cell wall biosynthesis